MAIVVPICFAPLLDEVVSQVTPPEDIHYLPKVRLETSSNRLKKTFRLVRFNSNGSVLACSSDAIEVWNNLVPASIISKPSDRTIFLTAGFVRDSETVWAIDDDGAVRIYRPSTGFVADWTAISFRDGMIRGSSIHQDRMVIATASGDLEIWNLFEKTRVWRAHHKGRGVLAPLAWDQRGDRLASAKGNTVCVWNTSDGNSIGMPLITEEWSMSVALSGDGSSSAVGDAAGQIYVWGVASGKLKVKMRHAPDTLITGLSFSPDGNIEVDPKNWTT